MLTHTDKKIRFNLVYPGKARERENGMKKNEQAEMLRPEDALKAINIIFVHVPLVLYIVLPIPVLGCRLDKELPGIKQDFAQRHSEGAEI